MFRSRIPFYVLGSLLVLSACSQPPVIPKPDPLDFATDPRVLRGTWTGENEDGHTLRLMTEAGSPREDGYETKGTFRLDDEAPVAFSGGVRVPLMQVSAPLNVQSSPVCPGAFSAFSADSQWEFCGDAPEGLPPRLEVALLDQRAQGGIYNFVLTKEDDTSMPVQGHIIYAQSLHAVKTP